MKRLLCALCVLAVGCASAPPPAPTVARSQPRTEASTTAPEADDTPEPRPQMAIAGIRGSLTNREAHSALDPRMAEFAACFTEQGQGSVRGLGGDVTLHIIVHADGSVRTAFPSDSTVGHRDVERCLSDVAEATRFPRPRGGGEATLTWPISMDPPSDVRHPQTWDEGRVAHLVERHREDVLEACHPSGEGRIQVTAYTRSGRVLSAGASAEAEAGRDALDCVVDRVSGWAMPPTRRTAKVTFSL